MLLVELKGNLREVYLMKVEEPYDQNHMISSFSGSERACTYNAVSQNKKPVICA
jgi:hypothetical protein